MQMIFKYLKHNVRKCPELYLVLVFIHLKLYLSEQQDRDEIAQTHILS